jgi:hypothetical protein
MRLLAILGLICALATPAYAEGESDQQILGLTLGQSAPDPADMKGLMAAFSPAIAKDINSMLFADKPVPNYQIELTDSRRLRLWFDGAAKDRPIYWIELSQSYDPPPVPPDQYGRIIKDLGKPDYNIDGRQRAPLGALLIKLDPSLPDERKATIKQHIDAVIANRPDPSSSEDPFIELPDTIQNRLDILGDAFRGKIVAIYTISNNIDGTGTELIDTGIARSVLLRSQQ